MTAQGPSVEQRYAQAYRAALDALRTPTATPAQRDAALDALDAADAALRAAGAKEEAVR